MKKIISLILLFATLTLTSCGKNIYPRGFTGGIGIERGSGRQIAWVETIDDVYSSANILKNHNSTFQGGYIFDSEEYFDIKYCFIFDYDKDKIKYGDSHFDRWAENVEIRAYGFFDEITIDELNFSLVSDYDHITISFTDLYKEKYADEYIDPIFFECRWDENKEKYFGTYNEEQMFSIDLVTEFNKIPSDSHILAIMYNMIYIGEE
jgi:hypothetical protein